MAQCKECKCFIPKDEVFCEDCQADFDCKDLEDQLEELLK